ncbi:hypothetical protein [Listeria sp. PSOL-1]|uniref:hypothetical protein n=1 Tax=Listeria sp. PSOL-1 TaxID=1844999 RepID=UPI0013D7F72E|nr:hypothetical protein [Listeria sp. PSOL-1]
MKKKGLCILMALFSINTLLGGCGDSEKPTKKTETQAKKVDVEDKNVAKIKKLLSKSLGDNASINYVADKKQFDLIATSDQLKQALTKIKDENTGEKEWQTLVQAFKQISLQIKAAYKEDYSVRLADPNDTKESLLTVRNGEVIYNFKK